MLFRKQNTITKTNSRLNKNRDLFSMLVLSLVVGLFIFSWIDKDARDAFSEVTKIGVTGYVALLVPSRYDSRDR